MGHTLQHISPSILSALSAVCNSRAEKSSHLDKIAGIPQGSMFGPLLLRLHINDLPVKYLEAACQHYADDANISKTTAK